MQRLACLLMIGLTAACGSDDTDSGPATLTGIDPPGMSVGARVFTGPDAMGTMVLGWKLEFFEQAPGAACLSSDTKVVATIAIYTNQPDDGSKDQAMLQIGDIPIVSQSPPTVNGNATATMTANDDVTVIKSGIVSISEFHLTSDAIHADRIKGTVSAGGMRGDTGVSLTGDFDAPYCPE